MKEYWLYGIFAAALASPPPHLKGRVEALDGGGNYTTMVLPLVQGGKQYAMMSFCSVTGSRPTEERRIYPIFASLYVSYPDKKVEWRDVQSDNIRKTGRLLDSYDKPYLGILDRSGISVSEWQDARERYAPLVSLVIERRWLLANNHVATFEERNTAKELQECIRILYDKPLMPYYQHYGSNFLAWIEKSAK